MTQLRFSVPGPVRGKGRPRAHRVGAGVRMHTDAATTSYENWIKACCQQALDPSSDLPIGPLRVSVVARFAVPASASKRKQEAMLASRLAPTKTPDADNILKCLDALNGIAWKDDAQIVALSIYKVYGATPGLDITIEELDLMI